MLAAILFPVFGRAREKGRSAVCESNLRQIGMAVSLYTDDYDDLFPWGADAIDKNATEWAGTDYQTTITGMPQVTQVLATYINAPQIWHCPSDSGFTELDNGFNDLSPTQMSASPSEYQQYGMSYGYRTELALTGQNISTLSGTSEHNPGQQFGTSDINVFFDDCGNWHGDGSDAGRRYNVLFADGHVKNQTALQFFVTGSFGITLPNGVP
jgi:prepilin-type processing-associated H-X9-DG protein